MNQLSVRARLTLWNVAILSLVLITLGVSTRAIVRFYLLQGVDFELNRRVKRTDWARKIWFENGKFVLIGRKRDPSDNKDTHLLLNAGSAAIDEENKKKFPDAPARDSFGPRLLNANGEPLIIPTDQFPFRGASAWDRIGITQVQQTHYKVTRTIQFEGEPYRIITQPIGVEKVIGQQPPPTDIPGFLQLAFRLTDVQRGLDALDRTLLTLLPLSLLVAGFGGAILTGRALKPVRDITLATDRIAAESLSGRLPVVGNDEFSELSRRFNEMLGRLEASFERQSRFVADASHELRTPLAIVTANVSLALDDEMPATLESDRRALTAIHGAANRMNRIVGDLLLLAKSDDATLPIERKLISLDDVLSTAIEEARTAYKQRTGAEGATVAFTEPAEPLTVRGDSHQLHRVFVNLLENALRHTPANGMVTVDARIENGMAKTSITDTGSGIAAEHLPRLFDRFYRVDAGRDRERGGTGLGLAIVQTLVTAHNGTVSIDSEVGVGTEATVSLPIA